MKFVLEGVILDIPFTFTDKKSWVSPIIVYILTKLIRTSGKDNLSTHHENKRTSFIYQYVSKQIIR